MKLIFNIRVYTGNKLAEEGWCLLFTDQKKFSLCLKVYEMMWIVDGNGQLLILKWNKLVRLQFNLPIVCLKTKIKNKISFKLVENVSFFPKCYFMDFDCDV